MELAPVHEFNATSLTISTCTVLCNLNKRLSLELITRFVPVLELLAPELNEKSGGLYNIEFTLLMENSTIAAIDVYFWLIDNTVNIQNSNKIYSIAAASSFTTRYSVASSSNS